jgi:hypothetical protein
VPVVGFAVPAMSLRSVDFPDPLAPTTPETLAALDGEAHILQGLDDLSRRDLAEDELFERWGAAGPQSVALLEMFGADRDHVRHGGMLGSARR